jgi:hypothetical protein
LNSISTVFNSSCETYFKRNETPNGDAADDAAAAVPAALAIGLAGVDGGLGADELADDGVVGCDEPEAPDALDDDDVGCADELGVVIPVECIAPAALDATGPPIVGWAALEEEVVGCEAEDDGSATDDASAAASVVGLRLGANHVLMI